jgi:hypothetical protein
MNDDKLKAALDKVTKLRALGDRATTQAEREACYAQAEAIIAKYQIDVAQIDASAGVMSESPERDPDGRLWSAKKGTRSRPTWLGQLANGIAQIHGCAVIWCGASLELAGRKSDLTIVRYLFAWLRVEIDRLAQSEEGRAAMNAFRLGAVAGVLRVMRASQRQESATASGGTQSFAMVLSSRSDIAKECFGKVYAGRSAHGSQDRSGAFGRGKVAGENLSPRPGLTAGGHKMLGA